MVIGRVVNPVVENPRRGIIADSGRRVPLKAALARRCSIGAKSARFLAVGVAQILAKV